MQTALLERQKHLNAKGIMARALKRTNGAATVTDVLGRIGRMEVRLARNQSEISAAQEIRFRVFYDELGATNPNADSLERRDADRFDPICDHLVVFDTQIEGPEHKQIVGTYRLLRQDRARESGGFYTDDEFQLEALIERHPKRSFLELGRSCVLPEYRSKRTVELLWQGIWSYSRLHGVDVMTGCASFSGTIPAAHAQALSFLAHKYRAVPEWDVAAVPSRFNNMDLVPEEAIDTKSAIGAMPPLVKGYLRIGAMFGDGCVIDPNFATTDVLVILPVERITNRFINYYGADADRFV